MYLSSSCSLIFSFFHFHPPSFPAISIDCFFFPYAISLARVRPRRRIKRAAFNLSEDAAGNATSDPDLARKTPGPTVPKKADGKTQVRRVSFLFFRLFLSFFKYCGIEIGRWRVFIFLQRLF